MQLERRREGLALIDPGGQSSDRAFPRTGSPAQLALLLAEQLAIRPPPRRVDWPTLSSTHWTIRRVIDMARPVSDDPMPATEPSPIDESNFTAARLSTGAPTGDVAVAVARAFDLADQAGVG